MIHETKLRLMTKAEMVKNKNKRDIFIAEKFYAADFVLFQAIIAVVAFTLAFVLIFTLIFLNQADTVLVDMSLFQILDYMKQYLWIYIILLIVVLLIVVFTSTARFWKAQDILAEYKRSLEDVED